MLLWGKKNRDFSLLQKLFHVCIYLRCSQIVVYDIFDCILLSCSSFELLVPCDDLCNLCLTFVGQMYSCLVKDVQVLFLLTVQKSICKLLLYGSVYACLNTTSQTFVHSVASLLIFFSASILKPDLWILLLVRSFDNHENFIFINFRHFFLFFFCNFKITLHKTMKKTVTSISCMEYDCFNNLILVDYECGQTFLGSTSVQSSQ